MHILRPPAHVLLILLTIMLIPGTLLGSAEEQTGTSALPDPFMELSDSTVNSSIARYPLFVLDCYIPGCEPCESMNITLSELSIELNGQPVAFGKVNMRKNTETATRYNITLYPTILIFNNGTVEKRDIGFNSKSLIVEMIEDVDPSVDTSTVELPEPAANQSETLDIPGARPKGAYRDAAKAGSISLADLGGDNPKLPIIVNDSTLDFALEKYPMLVLVGFANWCEYCKEMNYTALNLSEGLNGQVAFCLINAQENNITAERYNITSYPRFLIFKKGELISTQRANLSDPELAGVLRELEPGLEMGSTDFIVPLTSAPQEPATLQRSGAVSAAEVVNVTSQEDASLEYINRVQEVAEARRTEGTTINIFIININN